MTQRSLLRSALSATAAISIGAAPLAAQQKCPAVEPGHMPLKYHGGPTVAAITPCDLMTRLYIYADDSMRGREAGSPDGLRATAYIEHQVRRLGLRPAGDSGGYFQYLNVTARSVDPASTITVAGNTFHLGADFSIPQLATSHRAQGVAIFGGVQGDTVHSLTAEQVHGKIVVLLAAEGGRGGGGFFGGRRGGRGGTGVANPWAGAAAIITVSPFIAPERVSYALNDTVEIDGKLAYATAHPNQQAGRGRGGFGGGGLLAATVTPRIAEAMLGKPVADAKPGDVGVAVSIDGRASAVPAETRNVIGILPGSDPRLRGEYVLIGAHSDHIGTSNSGGGARLIAEHDSVKAYNMVALVEGADTRPRPVPTEAQWVRINQLKDSLRRIYPARPDSISN
ncbi:MAG: hypothetical protein ACRELE_05720, partial [Gemmatimonadales bacterium]